MKRIIIIIMSALSLGLLAAPQGFAVVTTTKNFVVHATLPAATGSSINASKVVGTTFTPVVGTTLDFNTGSFLPFNAANGIYIPDHFFAIDIAGSGGAGNPDVTISYGSESMPSGQAHGLGYKATATFMKVTGVVGSQIETAIAAHGPKKKLLDVSELILKSEYSGGFLRVYVGVVTKDATAAIPDPASSEPFTNSDLPGTYEGTIFISATVP